jgi:hypothetical protein
LWRPTTQINRYHQDRIDTGAPCAAGMKFYSPPLLFKVQNWTILCRFGFAVYSRRTTQIPRMHLIWSPARDRSACSQGLQWSGGTRIDSALRRRWLSVPLRQEQDRGLIFESKQAAVHHEKLVAMTSSAWELEMHQQINSLMHQGGLIFFRPDVHLKPRAIWDPVARKLKKPVDLSNPDQIQGTIVQTKR